MSDTDPGTPAEFPPGRVMRARLGLLLLVAMFAAPVVLAWWMFYSGTEWIPTGKVNNGELVVPARPMDLPPMTDVDGKPVSAAMFEHKWTLLYLGLAHCEADCQDKLIAVRQLRLATNKDISRVATAYFVADGKLPDDYARWRPANLNLAVTLMSDQMAATDAFRVGDEDDASTLGRIYIVDPLGNLMMRYPKDMDPNLINKDLKRLLKISALR